MARKYIFSTICAWALFVPRSKFTVFLELRSRKTDPYVRGQISRLFFNTRIIVAMAIVRPSLDIRIVHFCLGNIYNKFP